MNATSPPALPASPAPGPIEGAVLAHLAGAITPRTADVGGARLRYLEGGKGPALVLIHGRGHAGPMWLPYLVALARRHRVIAVDLPGFGQSTAPALQEGADGTPRTEEPAGLAFFTGPVEALLAQLGVTEAAVIGHSMGAMLGIELALRGRIRISRLVLIGPMAIGPAMTLSSRLFFKAGPERIARALGPRGFARISSLPPGPMGDRLNALGYELLSVPGGRPAATAAFNTLFPVLGPAFHRRAELPRITAPALLVCGERDEVFPPANARAAVALLPAGRLQLLPLGHSPHHERPDQVLPMILQFLTEGAHA